jgi:potassium voltage-gated channel Eag-related subfamily H protein 7
LLYLWNRFIDLIFLLDMILQFNLVTPTQSKHGRELLKNRRAIARKYIRGWFLIDLISILPFDSVGCFFDNDTVATLRILRVLRLIRMLKLLRLLRASRILARLAATVSLPTSAIVILKAVATLTMGAHWMACVWGLIGRTMQETNFFCWIDALHAAKPDGMDMKSGFLNVYIAALHWAVMTLTSIGYGDIAPVQREEYVVGLFCQTAGGVIWAIVIGLICALLTTSDPGTARFRVLMDELNHMLVTRDIDKETSKKVRLFFIQAKSTQEQNAQRELLWVMSPSLRAEIANISFGGAIRGVWFMRPASDAFIASIAVQTKSEVLAQGESITQNVQGKLVIMQRGLSVRNGKVTSSGQVWGEDFVLSAHLRRASSTIALTFVEVLTYDPISFYDALGDASLQDYNMVRKRIVRFIFVRGMLYAAAQEMQRRQKLKRAQSSEAEDAHKQKKTTVLESVKNRNQKKVLTENREDLRILHLLEYELDKVKKNTQDLLLPLSEKLDRMQEQIDALQQHLAPGQPPPQSILSTVSQYEEAPITSDTLRENAPSKEIDASSSNILCANRV